MAINPITLSVVSNAFVSIVEEMTEALKKSSHSSIIREMLDFACAIYDPKGLMVSTAPQIIPGLLGHMDSAVAYLLKKFSKDEIHEGDVFIANDPYRGGGSHIPDIHIMTPLFFERKLIGFAVINAHHIDMGGPYPGGEGLYSTSIFHEGLRIPTTKLYEAGKENRSLFEVISSNVRDPRSTIGDLRAQLAASKIAEERIYEVAQKYGIDLILECMGEVMDYSEKNLRLAIENLPDGHVSFSDYLESGVYYDPVKINIDMEVKGSDIIFDFTGTDPQVKGPINMLYSATKTCVAAAVKMIAYTDAPTNDGSFRPITINVPEGCVLNAQFPAAVGIRHITMVRFADMILHAFAKLIPEMSHAGAFAGFLSMSIGARDPATGEMKVMQDDLSGAIGGCSKGDGLSAVDVNIANLVMLSAEACEIEYPIRINKIELVQNSGGPGKYRGGLGIQRDYEFLSYEQEATVYTEQGSPEFAPWGLMGGARGTSPLIKLKRKNGEESTFIRKVFLAEPGDILSDRTGGGGGYGNPFERKVEQVMRDVQYGYISIERAQRDYGVVINEQTGEINREATVSQRGNRR